VTRLRHLLTKEVLQLRRDRRLFGILVIAPILQLLVLGYAARTDVREIDLAVRDRDRSQSSRGYVTSLSSSGYFAIVNLVGPESEDVARLVSGDAGLVLVIPEGFGGELLRGQQTPVQVLVDGSDTNFGVLGLSYLERATRLHSDRLVREALGRLPAGALAVPSITAEPRLWYNPGLSSTLYMVPGVMGVILMVTTMVVTSMALVKEREQGTMEQLIVTPLRSGELIAGKLLPFVAVGFAEVTLALPIMRLVFHVPLEGSVALFYLFTGLFLLSTLGIGLFVSTLVRTQQQAMMVAAFFVMMPFTLLSGFIFPVDNMPPVIRAVAYAMPLKYYLTAVRGIFLKGTGWGDLWPEAVVLLGWGAGILYLAVARSRKTLE
jgi:ABC-2 type transport system permease protein